MENVCWIKKKSDNYIKANVKQHFPIQRKHRELDDGVGLTWIIHKLIYFHRQGTKAQSFANNVLNNLRLKELCVSLHPGVFAVKENYRTIDIGEIIEKRNLF